MLSLKASPDMDKRIDADHNILCQQNTRYFFSGQEIEEGETLKRLLRLHLRLEEMRYI